MTASTFGFEGPSTGHTTAQAAPSPLRPAEPLHGHLTTTVPRELVHRAAVAEVVLTGWRRLGEARFAMTAQWPRGHSFFTPVNGTHHDPLIAAETIRQAGALLAHAEFGVPMTHRFLLEELAFTVRPEEIRVGERPAALDLDVTCSQIRRRGRRLAGMRVEASVLREGRLAARGRFSFSTISAGGYRRLRPQHVLDAAYRPLPPAPAAAPAAVGRLCPADVVLSPADGPDSWHLRADTGHPALFDHPADHAPGMLLLEAARQAATAALDRAPVLPLALDCAFLGHVELDRPCLIETRLLPGAAPDSPQTVLVTGRQEDRPAFTSALTAAPPG